MKLYPQSVCAFAILSLCCVLITVRESHGTFIPGRCMCPKTQQGVRGQLNALIVLPKSSTCHNVTVIVTLQRNNKSLCLNPEAPMAKQLIRCWNRVQQLGRDVKLCLKRKKMRGGQRQQTRQRRKDQNRKVSS